MGFGVSEVFGVLIDFRRHLGFFGFLFHGFLGF